MNSKKRMNTGLSIAFQPGLDEPTARASAIALVLDGAGHFTEQCKCKQAFRSRPGRALRSEPMFADLLPALENLLSCYAILEPHVDLPTIGALA